MDEREYKPKANEEPDVEGHIKPKASARPKEEDEGGRDDEPDVEGHYKPK